jgi:hypothetical protein
VLLQNCRNVLVRSNAAVPGGATAKLADFGLSRAMKQHQTHRTTKTCGTLSHMVSAACRNQLLAVLYRGHAGAVIRVTLPPWLVELRKQ